MKNLFTLSLGALIFAASSLFAGIADDAAKVRVLSGWRTDAGTHMAAIEFELADGWKTYWRAPGDTGIPPSFSWQGTRNVESVQFHWPVPEIFVEKGQRTLGYIHKVVVPVELTPIDATGEIRLKGKIEIGLCKEVCLPVSYSFNQTLALDGTRDGGIVASLVDRPLTKAEAGVKAAICDIEMLDDGIRLTASFEMPSAGGSEIAVIENPNREIWVSEPEVSRSGNMLTASSLMLSADALPFIVDRSQLRFTVIGADYAVDIQGCSSS